MATRSSKTPGTRGPRRSARDIAEQADRILAEAREREREYERKGMSSVTLPRDELIRKLSGKTAHSPFISSIGWGGAVRGSTFVLIFWLVNPDPRPYEILNLGLCFCYSDAGAVTDPGLTLLRAEPSIGVRQVDIGILNWAPTPYSLSANHPIPSGFRVGPADLNWFLYAPDSFAQGALLERGTIRVQVT